ncbi:HD domain-containing phosphohydrolase [Ruminiclostridium cellulolyticum]|uniref:Metal dependent phosphohydrolase n=1 Tax=Ruminiclostridium cellulolyticum (strain ATCC 35319 / DSM 5812 / JCM 6584 / H10) TaxID=394503 RepID=B8I394_RUMCH|nr:HD domain-containing phosphohydrolase [Ruminiclostridium cellulolyticum]ACL76237.1 metal dependent phosphohydrolase [Ruminiclostridium cellulolyticum H10]
MNLSKYYLHLVKIIICVIALPCFIYGIFTNTLTPLAVSSCLGIVLLAYDICRFIIDRRNRKNTKKYGSLQPKENILNSAAGKSHFRTLKLLVEKQNQLEALSITSEKFNSTIEIENIIKYVFDVFKKFTGCDRCLICFRDVDSQDIYCKYELGDINYGEVGKYFDEDSVITQCFNTNSVVVKCGIKIKKRSIVGDKLAIPLNISDEQLGVIFLETKNKETFKKVNLIFLQSLANYAAVAMYKSQLINDVYIQKQEIEALYEETAAVNDDLNHNIESLNKAKDELRQKNEELLKYSESLNTGYIQTVMSLVHAIEAKDAYTSGHCQRVMEISCEIATRMNLDEDTIQDLRYAAILHDIGKIGVSASILNKTGKLTDGEFEEIRKHPQISYNILKNVEFLRNGLRAILEHHEKYNGGGYPNGLKGEEISLLGRILCIADAFDAMTSDRTYRRGMTMEVAINEIERCKGIQFDPRISDLFINMIKELINN